MLKSWFVKENYKVETATSVLEAKQRVKEMPFDLILSDIRMPDADGFSFLSWVKRHDSDIIVMMMTGFADIETAVESIKSGAVDYIAKPIDPDLLFKKVTEAFKNQDNHHIAKKFASTFVIPPGEAYTELRAKLDEATHVNSHFLLVGARGTGKTTAVKYIYDNGLHKTKPFLFMDCEQTEKELEGALNLPQEENQSLLRKYLEMAKGGLLFIRQVENLSMILQAELATVLRNQENDAHFTQIIASSEYEKTRLEKMLLPKLFQILGANYIELPRLEGRKDDILFFANYFLNFANVELNKSIKNIAPEIQEMLMEHTWSGNIQELKNTILKAALLTEGTTIGAELTSSLFKNNNKARASFSTTELIEGLKKENYEKEKIMEALELAKGNKTMAASILNIDRKTLYNKIKLYGVDTAN